jgi:hypothetical protein
MVATATLVLSIRKCKTLNDLTDILFDKHCLGNIPVLKHRFLDTMSVFEANGENQLGRYKTPKQAFMALWNPSKPIDAARVRKEVYRWIDKYFSKKEEIKEKSTDIRDVIIESYPDEIFLFIDGFDGAILGICEKEFKVIYSVTKCIDILKQDMSEEDAIEHFSYNIEGAYVGDKTPIFCYDMMA